MKNESQPLCWNGGKKSTPNRTKQSKTIKINLYHRCCNRDIRKNSLQFRIHTMCLSIHRYYFMCVCVHWKLECTLKMEHPVDCNESSRFCALLHLPMENCHHTHVYIYIVCSTKSLASAIRLRNIEHIEKFAEFNQWEKKPLKFATT